MCRKVHLQAAALASPRSALAVGKLLQCINNVIFTVIQ